MIHLWTGYPATKTEDNAYYNLMINTVAIVSCIMTSGFIGINYLQGHETLALVESVSLLFYALCLLPLNKNRLMYKRNLALIGTSILMLSVFIDGGVAKVAIFWSLIIPFVACLFFGLPRAWYWSLGYAGVVGFIIMFHVFWQPFLPYSDAVLMYFPVLYLLFAILAAIFQVQFERLEAKYQISISDLDNFSQNLEVKVQNRTEALEAKNLELKEEMSNHNETAIALRQSEERMFEVQKMEAIDTLVGGIAHDFNNMLAGINANMFMIKQKVVDNPDLLRRSKDVEKLVMNASDMVRQLLTFARKDHVEFEVFDMATFLNEAYQLTEVAVSEHIQMRFDNHVSKLLVEGNKTQIQQVLMNMINNARDAVKSVQTPNILVSLQQYEAEKYFEIYNKRLLKGKYAVLTIRDNGEGIPQDKIEKIFEPFFTTKEVGKGTGLGLAMCFGAIQSHGGAIRVRSKVGSGTIFEIFIPVAENTTAKPVTQEVARERLESGETILLVDDDDQLRESQKDALESIGYEVITAKNGKEAIETYKEMRNSIDLIISDLTMPVMGGVRAAKEIRKIEPDVKIMFITGYDRDSTFNGEGLPNVGEVLLEKPYTMFQLHDVIQKQLQT